MRSLDRKDVHDLLFNNHIVEMHFSFVSENDSTVLDSEEGVILANSYIPAGEDISTTLAH